MEIKDLNGKLLKTIDKTHYVNVVFCNINLYGANYKMGVRLE